MTDEIYIDAMTLVLLIPIWVQVVAAVLIAGFGRAMVGDGAWSRGIVYPLTAGFAAFVGFGLSWWTLIFGAVTAVTLSSGFTDWKNKAFMAARFGLPPVAVSAAYVWWMTWPAHPGVSIELFALSAWCLCCALVGAFYSTIQDAWADDDSLWLYDPGEKDSSRVAEFFAGAVIQGGPAILHYAVT